VEDNVMATKADPHWGAQPPAGCWSREALQDFVQATCPALMSAQQPLANDWSSRDVQSFVEATLLDHPCIDSFRHISGFVLASLTKEKLLSLTADDADATEALWEALQGMPKSEGVQVSAPPGAAVVCQLRELGRRRLPALDRGSGPSGCPALVFVRTQLPVVAEIEVFLTTTVAELKEKVSELTGVMPEDFRLIFQGRPVVDSWTLEACRVTHGSMLRQVLKMAPTKQSFVPKSQRGLLMIPAAEAWALECRSISAVAASPEETRRVADNAPKQRRRLRQLDGCRANQWRRLRACMDAGFQPRL